MKRRILFALAALVAVLTLGCASKLPYSSLMTCPVTLSTTTGVSK